MTRYLAGRLALTILTVFMAISFMFGVLHMAGDPVLLLVPVDSSAEHIERMRVQWGFADPAVDPVWPICLAGVSGGFRHLAEVRPPARSPWSWNASRPRHS